MANDKTIIHLHHDPLVLRVDEMVADAFGIKTAKLVAEIPLKRGRNEVDSVVWNRWLEQNKDGPLIRESLIQAEQPGEKHDGEDPESTFPGR